MTKPNVDNQSMMILEYAAYFIENNSHLSLLLKSFTICSIWLNTVCLAKLLVTLDILTLIHGLCFTFWPLDQGWKKRAIVWRETQVHNLFNKSQLLPPHMNSNKEDVTYILSHINLFCHILPHLILPILAGAVHKTFNTWHLKQSMSAKHQSQGQRGMCWN